MTGMTFAQFCPSDWRAGTLAVLSLEEEGLYIRGCAYMWDAGVPIPLDDSTAARLLCVQIHKYTKVMAALVAKGKMIRTQAGLINERVMDEIEAFRTEQRERSERAKKGHENRSMNHDRMQALETEIDTLKRRLASASPEVTQGVTPLVTPHRTPHRTPPVSLGVTPGVTPLVGSEKTNEINEAPLQAKNTTSANYNHNHIEVSKNPLPPTGSGGVGDRAEKDGRPSKVALRRAQARACIEAYNHDARKHGWTVCQAVTDSRLNRMLKRLDEIGGPEPFAVALRQVPAVPFLMGQIEPKDGGKPFKLDIDRLLSTGSNMGDVLAKLIDRAGEAPELVGPNGERWGFWRPDLDKLKTLSAGYWRKRLDDVKPNGQWPWWTLGPPPGHAECYVHPDVIAERGLVEIYQGRISH